MDLCTPANKEALIKEVEQDVICRSLKEFVELLSENVELPEVSIDDNREEIVLYWWKDASDYYFLLRFYPEKIHAYYASQENEWTTDYKFKGKKIPKEILEFVPKQ